MEARSSNTPSSSRAWEKQPKFLQDQILRLMAAHDDDIITEPIQSLATFLSLSSNTSAAQQFMAEYLQSILKCQDLRLDPFTNCALANYSLTMTRPKDLCASAFSNRYRSRITWCLRQM